MIDTHVHLNDEPLCNDLAGVLERARAAGVSAFIIPGYSPDGWRASRPIAAAHPGVHLAAGIHPMFADDASLKALDGEIAAGGLVAIGEIGLDYALQEFDKAVQMRVFMAQLDRAWEAKLPVAIHCRHAFDDLYAALREYKGLRGVLHSCSCSLEQIGAFLDLGYYVSFSGVVTRSQARKVKKLAQGVPLERCLIETDSPYIGTEEHPPAEVEPCHLGEIARALAVLKNEALERVIEVTTRNACDLFNNGM